MDVMLIIKATENFRECTGQKLNVMEEHEFREKDGVCGPIIYSEFTNLKLRTQTEPPDGNFPNDYQIPLTEPIQKPKRSKKEIIRTSSTRGRKPGQLTKGNHLWEFLRDLLHDDRYNPHLLKWEDREEGIFRIVQSEQVAKYWGLKKKKPKMSYEKMSRAIRFCRGVGYFGDVPKDSKYPKKLIFKFGEKAKDWHKKDPQATFNFMENHITGY